MWIEEQCQCIAKSQCCIRQVLFLIKDLEERFGISYSFCVDCRKDVSKPTELNRNDSDYGEQYDEDHQVFHQRDHGWRPQSTGVGVGRQDNKRNNERYVNVYAKYRYG